MSTRLVPGLIVVLGLSLVTYLLTVPMWRYAVVESDLLAQPFASAALQEWSLSPTGVATKTGVASGEEFVCLAPAKNGVVSFIAKAFLPPDEVDHLLLTAEVQADDLAPGTAPWKSARLLVQSFDADQRYLPYWPKDVASLVKSQDWQPSGLIIPLAQEVTVVQVVAFNGASSGRFCIKDLKLAGLMERPAVEILRWGMWGLWAAVFAWIAFGVATSSPSVRARAAVLLVAFAIVMMVILPQPYYAKLVSPLETIVQESLPAPSEEFGAGPMGGPGNNASPSLEKGAGPLESLPEAEDPEGSPSWARPVETAITWLRDQLSVGQIFHAVAFLVLAFLVGLAYPRTSRPVLLVGLATSVLALETLQLLIITRSSQWEDGLAGGAGVLMGLGLSGLGRGHTPSSGGPPASPSFDSQMFGKE
jgi:hypothetical protein